MCRARHVCFNPGDGKVARSIRLRDEVDVGRKEDQPRLGAHEGLTSQRVQVQSCIVSLLFQCSLFRWCAFA